MRKARVTFADRVFDETEGYIINVPAVMTDAEVKAMCEEAVRAVSKICAEYDKMGYKSEYGSIYAVLKEKGICSEAFALYIRIEKGYFCCKEPDAVVVQY